MRHKELASRIRCVGKKMTIYANCRVYSYEIIIPHFKQNFNSYIKINCNNYITEM